MSDLGDEEIREFAENVQWPAHHVMGFNVGICVGCKQPWPLVSHHDDCPTPMLPDFRTDLQACFDGLEWFCKPKAAEQTSGYWTLRWNTYSHDSSRNHYSCRVCIHGMSFSAHGIGDTVPTAIIRAVNAAALNAKEKV